MNNEIDTIGFYVKRICDIQLNRANAMFKKLDLTVSQIEILMYIDKAKRKGKDKIPQKDIETYFGLSHPTVSGILQRMKEKDFIEITVDENDKRFRNVALTEKIYNIGKELKVSKCDTEKLYSEFLTDEELESFKNILTKVYNGLRKKMNLD